MRNSGGGGYFFERTFFYRELESMAADSGLEKQAYWLIKHLGFSLADVYGLTLIERNTYIKFFNEENAQQKADMEAARNK